MMGWEEYRVNELDKKSILPQKNENHKAIYKKYTL
jgi:hypothetical protein